MGETAGREEALSEAAGGPISSGMKRRTLIIVLLVCGLGCDRKKVVEAANSSEPPTVTQSGDDWQRTAECAAQADRLAKRRGWVEGKENPDTTVTQTVINHYSPKFKRCYIQVHWLHNVHGKARETEPVMTSEIYDAFEGQVVAACTDVSKFRASLYCRVPPENSLFGNCEQCREFVKARMSE